MDQYTCGKCDCPVTRTTSMCPSCGVLLNGIECQSCSAVYSQSLTNCPNCGSVNLHSGDDFRFSFDFPLWQRIFAGLFLLLLALIAIHSHFFL